jgi:hypothetical protein
LHFKGHDRLLPSKELIFFLINLQHKVGEVTG